MSDTSGQLSGLSKTILTFHLQYETIVKPLVEKTFHIKRGSMTGRERATRAIEFKGPDMIPHQRRDFILIPHIPPQSWQPPEGYYPYVIPGYVQFGLWKWEKHKGKGWLKQTRTAIDEYGTVWRMGPHTSVGQTVKGALEDGWHLLDGYNLPDTKDWERYKKVAGWLRWIGGTRYVLGLDISSIWERFRFLRGFENALTDLVLHPEEVKVLLGMLTARTLDVVDSFKKAGAHGLLLMDDWGTQERPFISPRHFEEFFLPCYSRITARCHEQGMHCGMHSCGNIRDLVPLLIESGLDFLQIDSPDMCGVDWLAENAAGKICLACSVDIQNVFPTNNPSLIEGYVKDMIKKLGNHNGGLMAWPYYDALAIGVGYRAHRLEHKLFDKYGKYPLDLSELR